MEIAAVRTAQLTPIAQGLAGELASINKRIDDTVERIGKDANLKERLSSREHFWDVTLRLIMAILAVAAPALVTYSTTQGVTGGFKLGAILLSGLAGASATVQAILALQQNHVRNAIDALDLYELKARLEREREDVRGEDFEKFASLKVLLNDKTRTYREIIMGRQKTRLEQTEPVGTRM